MKKQVLFHNDENFLMRRADGAAEPRPEADAAAHALMVGQLLGGRGLSRRPGIHIGDWFVSAELLVLTAIFVTVLTGLRRR